jgi:hypothetical protein
LTTVASSTSIPRPPSTPRISTHLAPAWIRAIRSTETNPANVDETKYDDAVNFDEQGFRWDQSSNLVAELPVSLNAQDMNYRKPNGYGRALWYGVFDGSSIQVGDYLIGPGGTFFVSTMQKLLPILVVEATG